jgi:hypothetical protein
VLIDGSALARVGELFTQCRSATLAAREAITNVARGMLRAPADEECLKLPRGEAQS